MFSQRVLRSSAPLLGTAVIGGGLLATSYYISTQTQPPLPPAVDQTVQHSSQRPKDPKKIFNSGFSFQDLRLESSEVVNHNTKRLRFELPDKDAVSGLRASSALLTKATPSGAWLPVLRPYTPISDPDEPGHVDLLVKRYPDGKMSNHLHSLVPGQTLSFKTGPLLTYEWTPNKHSQIALITGGAGITPMYQLTHAILKNPEDKTKVTLIFGVNSDADVLFEPELRELEKKFPDRFRAVYTVSNPTASSRFPKGYVTRELLKAHIPSPEERDVKVLFCGPPAMEKAIAGSKGFMGSQGGVGGILKEMGYSSDQVFKF
ncbi:MAG: NADH-cytochrome b5 reductase [Alectoria fallacina]|uniref:NADH-cytochrome b5 reductase n=1 Tax=Alectoria fallacina TaxID=1903189 RepID=A0A8H3EG81_9LECA|nr:MAG: NADH-cytochrome b5 reductase [Alectoria fallacina]